MNILKFNGRVLISYPKGGNILKDYIEERVLEVAKYIIDSQDTIRKTANAITPADKASYPSFLT